jgi:mono/diheme cytochrome c family protein
MDRLNRRITLFGAGIALVLLIVSAAAFTPGGEALFMEQRCISCHRFKGAGGLTGPDLTDLLKRRGTFWVMRQIRNPKSHNPDSRMPSYEHLGYFETYAIISYLRS